MSDQVTITELVRNFVDGCRALVPALDRARVPWIDTEQYDNWDRVARALFETLVLEPCRFQVGESVTLVTADYGSFALSSEVDAFLKLKTPSGLDYRFISLRSVSNPFDSCEAWFGDDRVVVAVATADLSFVFFGSDGVRHELRDVDLSIRSASHPLRTSHDHG